MNEFVASSFLDGLGFEVEFPDNLDRPANYDDLLSDIMQFEDDPVGFTYYSFPWGEPGTPLEKFAGPEDWQLEILELIRDGIIDIQEAIVRKIGRAHV